MPGSHNDGKKIPEKIKTTNAAQYTVQSTTVHTDRQLVPV